MSSSHSVPLSAPGSIPPASAILPASDSWRVKSNPPQHQHQQRIQPRASGTPTFIASPPSALEQVESIAGGQDDLEVVDFSDMGKFVGASEAVEAVSDPSPAVKINAGVLSRPPRPVASDFFDESSLSGNTNKESEFGVKGDTIEYGGVSSQTVLLQDNDKGNEDQNIFLNGSFSTDTTPTTSMASTKEPLSHVDQEHGGPTNVPLNLNSQRTLRNQGFYKEAAMSALDDVMSRIKGALVGMQVNEVPKDLSQTEESRTTSTAAPQGAPKERWVPPALRPRNFDQGDEPQEVFLVTIVEPPTPPTGSSLVVRFPSIPRPPMDGINKRQLHLFSRPPLPPRMDILSFDPPIHDINRRDLSVNSVLFRIPLPGFKGKFRYQVTLPRSRGPRVHIPASKLPGVGAFGRPTISDGATTWRKSASPPTKAEENMPFATGLSTMSHSPAPQDPPVEASSPSMPKTNEDLSIKSDSTPIRSRSQPKMPVGSAVAFYRDSRIDVVEAVPKPLVNFIVGSELEDFKQTSEATVQEGMDVTTFTANSNDKEVNSSPATVNGVTCSPSTSLEQSLPSLVSKTESKSSDDSVRNHCTYEFTFY
jgi:serine/arginine repetitive matrix protein 2